MRQATGNPAPCAEVAADWAVLKDIVGGHAASADPHRPHHRYREPGRCWILLRQTIFAAAWQARHFVEERAGHALPRDALSLAINPPSARSQEQLHIHVDCISPDVRAALRTLPIGASWTMLPSALAHQRYAAMRLTGESLTANPFQLLAGGLEGAKGAMGGLHARAGRNPGRLYSACRTCRCGRHGSRGEDLQDHSCALAHQPAG